MTAFAEVGYYEPWWMQIAKSLIIFFVVFNLVPLALVADRKVLGRFQHRYGPNRVGPFGACSRSPTSASSSSRSSSVPRARAAGCSRSRR